MDELENPATDPIGLLALANADEVTAPVVNAMR